MALAVGSLKTAKRLHFMSIKKGWDKMNVKKIDTMAFFGAIQKANPGDILKLSDYAEKTENGKREDDARRI